MGVELKNLDRGELNDFATEHHADVIPDPSAYGNKGDLLEAVQAAQDGEPVPEPKAKASGATVKLTAAPEGTRSVRIGDDRFVIETPKEGVKAESVKAVQAFAEDNSDYEFEIA